MSNFNPDKGYVAILGWSLNAIDAIDRFDRRYVIVAPRWAEQYAKDNDIPFISWDFERLNERSMEIAERLKEEGVDVAIPLFEETVEWAGAINTVLLKNPRLMGQSLLMRDKALMKRRAQLGGIRVGIFEEAQDKSDVIRFLTRVNQALLKLDGDPNDPIHLKAFDKAGCLGHRVIRTADDVNNIPDEEFPVLMESHLDGWEFAVEAFIKDRKVHFLNISEYVSLGYSVFVPATPDLEKWRPRVEQEIEKLIEAFDIDFGFIHPEYFVTSDGEMYFGEVAYRPPGFNAFELIERAYGFNCYQALVMMFDPKTTQEEIDAFFPKPVEDATGHAGCFGVYPRRRVVSQLCIPEETENHPFFEFHELQSPMENKVPKRSAFGTHWGLVYFFGDDPYEMRSLLKKQEELDYYL
ncbi:MAG: carboxylate--amine ligase [Ketobacteraceae bacterium]|nr:carboxylate--amine ligase [Ketobacteraceae bacterium]